MNIYKVSPIYLDHSSGTLQTRDSSYANIQIAKSCNDNLRNRKPFPKGNISGVCFKSDLSQHLDGETAFK